MHHDTLLPLAFGFGNVTITNRSQFYLLQQQPPDLATGAFWADG
jgi:hypothetical protein